MSNLNLSQIANAIGIALGGLKKAEITATVFKETIDKQIAQLKKEKAVVGTYRKDGTGCALATGFIDGCVEAGLKASTAQNVYLPTFKKHVASGKPVGDWNSQRATNSNSKNEKKSTKASEPKSLANKLATCYRDSEFAEFAADLQRAYDNDEGSILECIKSYLESHAALKDSE